MDANASDEERYEDRDYHGLTARFLATMATSMPRLGWPHLRRWTGSPKDLQIALIEALLPFKSEKMLEFVGYEHIPPRIFVGREQFVSTDAAPIDFEWIDGTFKSFFMDGFEEGGLKSPEDKLLVHTLLHDRFDLSVLVLIGKASGSIRLSQFHALLAKQGKGQPGTLRVDGGLNVVHIVSHLTLWRVTAVWNEGKGWRIETSLTYEGDRLPAGTIVISR